MACFALKVERDDIISYFFDIPKRSIYEYPSWHTEEGCLLFLELLLFEAHQLTTMTSIKKRSQNVNQGVILNSFQDLIGVVAVVWRF